MQKLENKTNKIEKGTYIDGVLKVKDNLQNVSLEKKVIKIANGKEKTILTTDNNFKKTKGYPGHYSWELPLTVDTEDIKRGLDMLKDGGYLESYEIQMLSVKLQFNPNFIIQGRQMYYCPPDSEELERLAKNPHYDAMQQFSCYLNAAVLLRTIPFYTIGQEPKVHDGEVINEGKSGRGWLNYMAMVAGPGNKISIGLSPSWLHTGRAKTTSNAEEKGFYALMKDAGIPTVDMTARGKTWPNHYGLDVNENIRGYYLDVMMNDGLPQLKIISTRDKAKTTQTTGNGKFGKPKGNYKKPTNNTVAPSRRPRNNI